MVVGFFRECTNPKCRFRYPDPRINIVTDYCPKCGEISQIVNKIENESTHSNDFVNFREIIPILDNIRSIYNVGSIFRSCEGFGISDIVLTGITSTPDNPRFNKTSLGSISQLKWNYYINNLHAISMLKARGFQIICLENKNDSIPMSQITKKCLTNRICLVVGNELLGIDPGILKISDLIVSIPMVGIKESFNVSVAFGIAVYHLRYVSII